MTKKKNVVEKFKTWFTRLPPDETRQLYDLLCLLRGPDSSPKRVFSTVDAKIATTQRVRHILGVDYDSVPDTNGRVSGPASTDAPFQPTESILETVEKYSNPHFVGHVKDALKTLVELGYVKNE